MALLDPIKRLLGLPDQGRLNQQTARVLQGTRTAQQAGGLANLQYNPSLALQNIVAQRAQQQAVAQRLFESQQQFRDNSTTPLQFVGPSNFIAGITGLNQQRAGNNVINQTQQIRSQLDEHWDGLIKLRQSGQITQKQLSDGFKTLTPIYNQVQQYEQGSLKDLNLPAESLGGRVAGLGKAVPKQVKSFAGALAEAPLRVEAQIRGKPVSLANTKDPLLGPLSALYKNNPKLQQAYGNFLPGTEAKPYTAGAYETLRQHGVNPTLAGVGSLPLGLLGLASDVSGGGSVEKQTAKQVGKQGLKLTLEDLPKLGKFVMPENVKVPGKFVNELIPSAGAVSRFGPDGKQLSDLLHIKRDIADNLAGTMRSQIPTYYKLRGEEQVQFANALDALKKGEQVSPTPRVQQAIDEWSSISQQVPALGDKVGLKIGSQGKYYFPKNYDIGREGGKQFNSAVEHLLATKQAKTRVDAIKILKRYRDVVRGREFGHFKPLELDLPKYDKSTMAIDSYIQGAAERIAKAHVFGPDEGIALKLIDRIDRSGLPGREAAKFYDAAVGNRVFSEGSQKASNAIRTVTGFTKLQTAALKNMFQPVNTATREGIGNTLKGIAHLATHGRERAVEVGAISPKIIHDLRTGAGYARGKLGTIASPLFGFSEKNNRTISTIAGIARAKQLAKKGTEKSITRLREEYGIRGDIGKKLTRAQENQAARASTNASQFRVDEMDLPRSATTPSGRVVTQFKTFPYKQGGFMWNEIVKEAGRGNVAPLLRFLSLGTAAGYGAGKLVDTVRRNPKDSPARTNNILDALGNVGAFGLLDTPRFLWETRKTNNFPAYLTSSILGPSAGTFVETALNAGGAFKGQPDALKRQALKAVPGVGPTLSNTVMPFKIKGIKVADYTKGVQAADENSAAQELLRIAGVGNNKQPLNIQPGSGKITEADKKAVAHLPQQDQALAAQKMADQREAVKNRLGFKDAFSDRNNSIYDLANKMKEYHDSLPKGLDPQSVKVLSNYHRLTDKGKEAFKAQSGNVYALKLAEYKRDKAAGKLTKAEDYTRRYSLGKLSITSKYSEDVSDLYGLSKSRLKALVDSDPTIAQLLPQVLALDAELTQSGLARSKYFSSGSGGSGSGSTAIRKLATATTPSVQLLAPKKVSPPSFRIAGVRKRSTTRLGVARKRSKTRLKL